MSVPRPADGPAVKLVSGLLYPRDAPELRSWTKDRLVARLGAVERESEAFSFDCTDYYDDISPALMRCFFSFEGLRGAEGLVGWKKTAIGIEAESSSGPRRVNIDPGYIDGARLALASTKDNAHRIYVSDGIFAEVTLCRRRSGWESFSFTFPDFRSGRYDGFFEAARLDWRRDIRALKG
ncbi:MAG: DUF4416 family protein [Synergistaceae bacterium]|jgi:hypothetical protein|nr:DUF4416 family protein [Synergistaceae bacterium]